MNDEPKKRSMGRPSKLTAETIGLLVQYLEEGYTYAVCCAHAGITYRSFNSWMNKGKEAKQGQYFHFFHTINTAEMAGRAVLEAKALKESTPLSILERRWPEDWGKTERHEIKGGATVRIEWATLKDGEDV